MKFVGKRFEKVFTSDLRKGIIEEKYNPLNKDNSFYKGEGLFMRETKDIALKKLMEGLNWREKIIVKIYKKTCKKVYRKAMVDCFNYYNKDGTF